MSYPSARHRSYQIDVIDHVGRAYRAVIDNLQLVVEMALLPFLIVFGTELIALLIPGNGVAARMLGALIHALGFLVFGTVFMVRWHRFVLLGESVSGGLIPRGWRDFMIVGIKLGAIIFAGWVVLIIVASLPLHFLSFPLALFGGIALCLLALRVSLIFPAAAVERPIRLRTAWDWIDGNFWRLLACAFACYLPFVIAQMLVNAIASIFPSLTWIAFEAVRLAISFLSAAVITTLLSHLYREFAPDAPPI